MVFYTIFTTATLEEEDVPRTLLSVSELLLFSLTTCSSAMRGFWSASPAMEWEVGAAQQAVNGSSKRLEDESEKMMGLDVLSGAQLYMCNKRYYDDSFLQKICLSVSTT
jgi:hypothetical protein